MEIKREQGPFVENTEVDYLYKRSKILTIRNNTICMLAYD